MSFEPLLACWAYSVNSFGALKMWDWSTASMGLDALEYKSLELVSGWFETQWLSLSFQHHLWPLESRACVEQLKDRNCPSSEEGLSCLD